MQQHCRGPVFLDHMQVVVPPVLPHDPADGICVSPVTPVAVLPRPEAVFHSCGGLQLITPQPSKLLEADRPELFEVVAPAATAVAVGSEEVGWQELQLTAAEQQDQQQQQLLGTFRGHVIIPRLNKCFVAVKLAEDLQLQQADGSGWLPVISLRVVPQVRGCICGAQSVSVVAAHCYRPGQGLFGPVYRDISRQSNSQLNRAARRMIQPARSLHHFNYVAPRSVLHRCSTSLRSLTQHRCRSPTLWTLYCLGSESC